MSSLLLLAGCETGSHSSASALAPGGSGTVSAEPSRQSAVASGPASAALAPPTDSAGRTIGALPTTGAGANPATSISLASGKVVAKEYADTAAKDLGTLPEGVGLPVGARVAELRAIDSTGKELVLRELLKEQRVLLIFYRGGWCPYCNFQVRELTATYPEFQKLGIEPVLVSVDQVSEGAKLNATYHIPFPIISDTDLRWHKAFRVLNELDAPTVEQLRSKGIDVESASGQTHHTIAIPSIFLIEKHGTISFAHAARDYTTRPRTKTLLAALQKIHVESE